MFKSLLQRLFGNYLEKKADLYDGTPAEGKPWYKSKTILSGIVIVLRGIYEGISAILVSAGKPQLPPIPNSVDAILAIILGGTAIKGRVEANKPIVIAEGMPPTDQAPPAPPK